MPLEEQIDKKMKGGDQSHISPLTVQEIMLMEWDWQGNEPNEYAVTFYRDIATGYISDPLITINRFQTVRVNRNKSKRNK